MFDLIKKIDNSLKFIIYFPLAMKFYNHPKVFNFFMNLSGAKLITEKEFNKKVE